MKRPFYILLSFVIVTFGEPTSSTMLATLASMAGFVPLFLAIYDLPKKQRFYIGTLFFTAVQLIQLLWLTSHPYAYIYAVWILLSGLMGLQFGALCLLVTKKRLLSWRSLFAIPALWTLFEWSRLFLLTGFTFNPIGMAMAEQTEFLQCASVVGVYGLSFLVMSFSVLITRSFFMQKSSLIVVGSFLLIPSFAGAFHQAFHKKEAPLFKALIVETRCLPEELHPKDVAKEAMNTWKGIVKALLPYNGQTFDLILLPEIVVPFGAEAPIFEGNEVATLLQPFHEGLTFPSQVSSWQIASALATCLNSPLLIGLEGVEFSPTLHKNCYFNSGYFIKPSSMMKVRYDKQLLLPMAEEIPAEWVKPLAAQYGLFDSFHRGKGVVLFAVGPYQVATSICYEDTFPFIMRENARAGAQILTNLTNDGWYPNSKLGAYHFQLARLRAVENGRPLLRSCNFGVSGAIDAFGNTVVQHSFDDMVHPVQAFVAEVSTNHFSTVYTMWGNWPLLILCVLLLGLAAGVKFRNITG